MNLLASVAVLFALLQAPSVPSAPATFAGVYRGMESGRVIIEMGPDQNLLARSSLSGHHGVRC